MALSVLMTKALLPRLHAGMRIASMGYPDMIAPLDCFEDHVNLREIEYRSDSEAICRRHGIAYRGIPDAHSVFAAMGCMLDVYDIVQERGCEIVRDLNTSWIYANENSSYDFVLDVGTLEHCFNVAQAGCNMARLLKARGIILHENPFNWGNHGFYGMNPTWYADFYGQPGFRLLECRMVLRDGRAGEVPHTGRFVFTEAEANVFAVAERTAILPIEWPMQTKYRDIIADAQKEAA